jgi:hypothetical protein
MSAFDESSFYEIVELDNGDVALRRSEHQEEEPLLTIRFSAESHEYLGTARYEVARVMIEAGLDFVAEMESATDEEEETASESTLLH